MCLNMMLKQVVNKRFALQIVCSEFASNKKQISNKFQKTNNQFRNKINFGVYCD